MTKIASILIILLFTLTSFSQTGDIIENKATLFSIEQKNDTIDFIVVDTVLNQKKPVFLWCQGSLPIPLFCEVPDYGYYFLGGGISNFDYRKIVENYHLIIISMPKTPVKVRKENLNAGFHYIPNPNEPRQYLPAYIEADYLENYVTRAATVLKFLKKQKWVNNEELVLAGHSQGTKIATKIAVQNKKVTHLGLFAANPFGRIDQYVREARLNAQMGAISWGKADSIMNDTYAFYDQINNADSMAANPNLKAWQTFTEPYIDDWISLDIPIYLAYGTEDRSSDLCDIVPLYFIAENKTNLTLKRYLDLEHNFFELSEDGRTNHEKAHWNEVMQGFVKWIE